MGKRKEWKFEIAIAASNQYPRARQAELKTCSSTNPRFLGVEAFGSLTAS